MAITSRIWHAITVITLVMALLGTVLVRHEAQAQTVCNVSDRGVQLLWNEANGIPPDFLPLPQGNWVPTAHSQQPLLSAWHPADWQGIELTESWLLGIHISSPDGSAAYQNLSIYIDPSYTSQEVVSWGVTNLLGQFLGQVDSWTLLCQQNTAQSFPLPLGMTVIVATNGQTLVVAHSTVYTEPDLPQGIASFTAVAGPVEQFTALTEQVFLPLLYLNKVGGCTSGGVDSDGDGRDDCDDAYPYDPSR